ncbi:MAG: M17 family peptidase N-terminal domain-containing protein, partial [Pseudomonadota bacterium]
MSISIAFPKQDTKLKGNVIVGVFDGHTLGANAEKLDKKLGGLMSDILKNEKGFKASLGQTLNLAVAEANGITRIILLGLGKPEDLTALKAEEAGGKLFAAIGKSGITDASLIADKSKKLKIEAAAAHIANGHIARRLSNMRAAGRASALGAALAVAAAAAGADGRAVAG